MSKYKMRIAQTPRHDTLKVFTPAIAIALVGLIVSYQFVEPAPPKSFVLSAGPTNAAYYAYARIYHDLLAENGIDVQVRDSAGSLENIDRLRAGSADVAFVQTGVRSDTATNDTHLLSLGSLYLEPLWVIYRGDSMDTLPALAGKRIAVGESGSGTRALALRLLADNGITDQTADLKYLPGKDAATALTEGTIDAACFVMSPTAPLLTQLLAHKELQLMNFTRAAAICNRHRYLTPVQLHRGVIDPANDVPPAPRTLVSAVATLVIQDDFHPALRDLLLDAADRIHGKGNWVEAPGAFPSPHFTEFELADQARDFHESGRSFLQRVFPFWAATLINRLKIMLIPLLTLLLPLMKLLPPVYQWRIRRRINCWYKALQELESAADSGDNSAHTDESLEEIAHIEEEVAKVKVPPAYGDNLYQLRFHTSIARTKLETPKKESPSTQRRDNSLPPAH